MDTKKGLGRLPQSILNYIDDQKQESIEQTEEVMESTKESPAWVRATFIIDQHLNERIKTIAFWERTTIKELVNTALTKFLETKQEYPIPKKK